MDKALKLAIILILGLASSHAQILAPIFQAQPTGGGGSSPSYVTGGAEDCTAGVGNAFSITCTATTSTTGRTLEIFVASDGTAAVTSITDSNGSPVSISANAYSSGALNVYQEPNAASGAHAIQANWSGGNGGGAAIAVVAYSGANSSSPLDATPTFYGGTFAMASAGPNCGGATGTSPYTTANSNTSVISAEATTASAFPTAPTGFTAREQIAGLGVTRLIVADNAPSPGTGTASSGTAFSLVWGAANNYWGCAQYAIKP